MTIARRNGVHRCWSWIPQSLVVLMLVVCASALLRIARDPGGLLFLIPIATLAYFGRPPERARARSPKTRDHSWSR